MLSKEFIYEFNNNNKSGKMSVERFVKNNYKEDYDIIINYCQEKLNDIPFKQKVYHCVSDINYIVKCKHPSCDNKVNFKNTTIGYMTYCSNKCIGSDPDMIKLKEEKSIAKFGTKTPGENQSIKDKTRVTNNKKYGGDSPMSNKEVQEKSKKTLIENWGVDNINKHPDILNKRVNTFKENIDTWKENYKKTSLEKYGVEHPWMNNDIHNKSTQSNYYVDFEKIFNEKIEYSNGVLIDYDIETNGQKKYHIKCNNCNQNYYIHTSCINYRVKNKIPLCTLCNPKGSFSNVSSGESNLVNFIKGNYNKEIILNNRSIINPYELDIYLPDINLAIEFNGLYWHSELNKEKDYHLNKTKSCEDNGIQLMHVWEDDWVNKKDIIKSMLLNKMGITPNKIYARNCIICKVGSSEYRKFLNENHIQGYSPSSHSLGLYYKDELVSLMTFCKPRKMMGQKKTDGVLELSRFCNRLNTNVIGGASKLFKNFIKDTSINQIFSFSDKSYSSGNLYKILGFVYSHQSKINYSWVINKERKHRYNFTKYRLIEMGYNENKSERDIMYEDVGSYRIWNCGQDKWIYTI